MIKSARTYLIVSFLLAALAGMVAAWCTTHYFSSREQPPSLHQIIHRDLGLTTKQQEQVSDIEARYSAQRQRRENEMRAANARLAASIETDRQLSEEVQAAIEDFHIAMGELQMETIRYVFEIRETLTPEQQARFDATVTAYLTEQEL
ncbi:periplasmic heavy metal sensor [Hyphomonas sp. WL0036]|uniref:Spy/CpxP family protein refolding chaperone n=1 Tax=Hyphomonas sediminis TaxID=2866160 RepID=UPI001C8230D8|nr:periplasmic heavy metal sensor [Hyphomonas sediminis]MBY9067466.1 periplasmic heavy metal sensor [Hyphomonas sediminis]